MSKSAHALSAALCGGLLLAGVPAAAPADALESPSPPPSFGGPGGCTTVTESGGMLCVWVDSDSEHRPLFVKTVRTSFIPPDSESRACINHYELTYHRDGGRSNEHVNRLGCPPATEQRNDTDFPLNTPLQLDKPICARAMGPTTDGKWTQQTCVTLHDGWSEVGNTDQPQRTPGPAPAAPSATPPPPSSSLEPPRPASAPAAAAPACSAYAAGAVAVPAKHGPQTSGGTA